MTEEERKDSGKLYDFFKLPNAEEKCREVRAAINKFNANAGFSDISANAELKKIFGKTGKNVIFEPPFCCDLGDTITIGEDFYANKGLLILDEGKVTFGNNVWIGPRVSIYTAGHPLVPEIRNKGVEFAKPVAVGDNVWLGGNVVITPGVSIGSGSVIGAGSVVTKDIPENVVAAGNPCRVIREIGEKDRDFWEREYEEYLKG